MCYSINDVYVSEKSMKKLDIDSNGLYKVLFMNIVILDNNTTRIT